MRRLRRVLDDKGISIKGCADLLGVTEKTLYNKLTGANDFYFREAMKLKAMLPEYDIAFLLNEDATE